MKLNVLTAMLFFICTNCKCGKLNLFLMDERHKGVSILL